MWRDGFEDWRPLAAFPELVAVVEEGIASAKSMVPPPGDAPAVEPYVIARAATPPEMSGGARVAESAAIGRHEPSVASPAKGGESAGEKGTIANAPVAALAAARPIDHEPMEIAGLSQPKIPLAAWIAVAMALLLGVTIGIVVIKPDPPKPIIKYVEVPAKATQPQAASPNAVAAQTSEAPLDVAQNVSPENKGVTSGSGRVGPGSSKPTEPAPATSIASNQGLKGLSGLRGVGPQGGPSSEGAAASSGGAQLDSATLTRTVSRYTPSVKRSCWQPALDMRSPDAPTTARVTATITVAPNGHVQNVTTSGDPKGYRGLASCIQQRVRSWEFPPSGGTTEFNVPFVFAAQ
ncbi:MAG: AgmX/PglI C-terminal domain-containing protein [Polyangiaceae bacterium]